MSDSSDPTQGMKIAQLCPADAEALDALLAQRAAGAGAGGAGPMPPNSAQRVKLLAGLLGVLDSYPAQTPSADLVERTLARAGALRQQQRFTLQVQMLAEPRRTVGASWGQIISGAAVFVIAASLLMPVLERNRVEANRVACATNLGRAGQAMSRYAQANNQALPRRHSLYGGAWWHVGKPAAGQTHTVRSNTAHLYLLVRTGYLPAEDLACPENANAPAPGQMTAQDQDWFSPQAVSYSYQNQFGLKSFRADADPAQVLLADKNPLFIFRDGKLYYDAQAPQHAVSRLHQSRGQNILQLDGSSSWTVDPFIRLPGQTQADDIYRAKDVVDYDGDETPANDSDSFLVP